MSLDQHFPKWPDKLEAWVEQTRTRRLLAVLTMPIWLFVAAGMLIPWMLACLFWDGDPGKCIRWIWKGKA